MNYFERLALEIETRKSQLYKLKQKDAFLACSEIEKEIELLQSELHRYKKFEDAKTHHFYNDSNN
jgi:hypothetical protein